MLSEVKLKHLENFINSTTNLDVKYGLTNNIKPNLKNIEDEELLLKIANIKLRFSENIIGIYNENDLNYVGIFFLSERNRYECGVDIHIIYKNIYETYKNRLRLKKLNNINK